MANDAASQKGDGGEKKTFNKRRLLRVDQIWSRKDRQWHFVKTAKPKAQDRFRKYTFVVRRIVTIKGMVSNTEVDIKSPKLADVLLKAFEGMEGMSLTKNPPYLDCHSFFHAYPHIAKRLAEEEAKESPDQGFTEDLKAALAFLDEEFSSTIADLESLLKHGDITYSLLWALFPPHELAFSKDNVLKEPQAMRFVGGRYHETQKGNWFSVSGSIVTHDGEDFGWGTTAVLIKEFEGTKKITGLPVFPMGRHPECAELRERLRERGRAFVELMSKPNCREYQGMAGYQVNKMEKDAEERFLGSGRIMVDPIAFRAQNPNDYLMLEPWVPATIKAETLTEDDLVLCNYRALGFSFSARHWGAFSVSGMSTVDWNLAAFSRLILEDRKRRLIRSLVLSHRTDDGALSDVIAGKGKGLVGLLSGSPGVGKTLTAEAVAELSMRPLYTVSAGELGTTVAEVEKRLVMVLEIARRWRCVLLIDEADVFLYKRSETQLERNAVVSVFLRRLETDGKYFQGIVVLTTNRQKDIDEAFKTRIHFKFHYPPIEQPGRLKIWKNFIASLSDEINTADLTDGDLEKLSQRPMNGREIKNAVSCAASIVRANKGSLTLLLLVDILESLTDDFEDDAE